MGRPSSFATPPEHLQQHWVSLPLLLFSALACLPCSFAIMASSEEGAYNPIEHGIGPRFLVACFTQGT